MKSDMKEEMFGLKVNKARGLENVSPKLIKPCHNVLTKPLALFF